MQNAGALLGTAVMEFYFQGKNQVETFTPSNKLVCLLLCVYIQQSHNFFNQWLTLSNPAGNVAPSWVYHAILVEKLNKDLQGLCETECHEMWGVFYGDILLLLVKTVFIILLLIRNGRSINEDEKHFSYRCCVSLTLFAFEWWHHNWLRNASWD